MVGKRIILVPAFAGALLLVGVSSASAGEITGNGKPAQGATHANSICAYSGQNDTPNDPFPEGGRVQSYGQLVRVGLKDAVPAPGVACNGHTGFLAGGGEEP
ncbi:hypothetical protein RKE38_04045 [Phycicoccus sp. M110.8]|uniref:hypothetical protein n=1 Tax=Phycicoccus sp. M110.8 TaxID=3075433 RepID=UPI0028FD37F3|nr:hypothetical protein [Phycicoccus sp. M110.8]MDU0312847.1 hypothetical protein [Phycicoccus sp. M110.8]HET8767442.1 hypothetical protein [Pedococcus sp.]